MQLSGKMGQTLENGWNSSFVASVPYQYNSLQALNRFLRPYIEYSVSYPTPNISMNFYYQHFSWDKQIPSKMCGIWTFPPCLKVRGNFFHRCEKLDLSCFQHFDNYCKGMFIPLYILMEEMHWTIVASLMFILTYSDDQLINQSTNQSIRNCIKIFIIL